MMVSKKRGEDVLEVVVGVGAGGGGGSEGGEEAFEGVKVGKDKHAFGGFSQEGKETGCFFVNDDKGIEFLGPGVKVSLAVNAFQQFRNAGL
eukprot:scaffold856_cov30-Attheya_sp.AAC.1